MWRSGQTDPERRDDLGSDPRLETPRCVAAPVAGRKRTDPGPVPGAEFETGLPRKSIFVPELEPGQPGANNNIISNLNHRTHIS